MSKFPPRPIRLYEELASRIIARLNCIKSGNDYQQIHEATIDQLIKDFLPSGSGIDHGTTIDLAKCTADRIVLSADFHHMDDGGGYAGWTEHTITIRPSFIGGFELTISGRDRNGIKEYLADVFQTVLSDRIIWDPTAERYVRYAVPELT